MKRKLLRSLLLILPVAVIAALFYVDGAPQVAANETLAVVSKPFTANLPAQDDLLPIAEEIDRLIADWQGETLASTGWVHVVSLHDRTKAQSDPLPNGALIPVDYISETWYLLQEAQLVQLVAFMKDLDGNIIQTSTYQAGLWRNLTIGEEWQGEADAFGFDYGFVQNVLDSHLYGSQVSREESETEIIFSIRDEFPQAVQMEGYEFMVIRGERRLVFDKASGALQAVERILVSADGARHLVEQITFSLIERTSPPSEVVRLLEGG